MSLSGMMVIIRGAVDPVEFTLMLRVGLEDRNSGPVSLGYRLGTTGMGFATMPFG
jgi:hypothetical protein